MDNRIYFTQEELQLLYAACMSYGEKLDEIVKSIPNESFAVNGLGNIHGLVDRAKDIVNDIIIFYLLFARTSVK